MRYHLNFSLLDDYGEVPQHVKYPMVAVFNFDGKKLLYVGTEHNSETDNSLKTFDAINYCFDNYDIDFIVTECPHVRKLEDYQEEFGKPYMNELIYAPLLGKQKNVGYAFVDSDDQDWFADVVQADASLIKTMQAFFVLDDAYRYKQSFGQNLPVQNAISNVVHKFWKKDYPAAMDKEDFEKFCKQNLDIEVNDLNLSDILQQHPEWNAPDIHGNIINQAWTYINKYSRDTRMLSGISEALSGHNCVLATMGAGHFDNQRRVLESAFGKPEIIYNFPSTPRRDK